MCLSGQLIGPVPTLGLLHLMGVLVISLDLGHRLGLLLSHGHVSYQFLNSCNSLISLILSEIHDLLSKQPDFATLFRVFLIPLFFLIHFSKILVFARILVKARLLYFSLS